MLVWNFIPIITNVKMQCSQRTDIRLWWSWRTRAQIKNKLLLISFCMLIQLRNSWNSILGRLIWRRLLGMRLLTRMLHWVLALIWLTLASMRNILNVSNTLILPAVTRIVPWLSTDIAWFVSLSTLLALGWHWFALSRLASTIIAGVLAFPLSLLFDFDLPFALPLSVLLLPLPPFPRPRPSMRSISIGTVSLLLVPPVVSSEDWSKLLHFWCALSHLRTSSGSSGYLQFSLRFKLKWVFRAPVMQSSMIAHFNSSPKTVPALRFSSKASSKRKTCAWSDFDTWKAGQAVTEDSKASPLAWVLGLIDSVSCLRASNPLPAGAARAMLNALFFTSPARSPQSFAERCRTSAGAVSMFNSFAGSFMICSNSVCNPSSTQSNYWLSCHNQSL